MGNLGAYLRPVPAGKTKEFYLENFKDENIRVKFIGDPAPLADDIKALMKKNEDGSKDATGLKLNIAINYGGRNEILSACKRLAEQCARGERTPESLTEQDISDNLYTAGQPDPDLIIRPSGEFRLSNFLIWQAAYSEFIYSDILWPDYTERDFDAALEEYAHRSRRFGGV